MKEIEKIDENLKFCSDFIEVYNIEKDKLPYHINLLDILWANENAHSRIFAELIKQNNCGQYEVLNSFMKYMNKSKPNFNFNFEFEKPIITAETERIDTLIVDNSYGLIIENKIHDAKDQEGQLARYIIKVRSKGIKVENIFVVYLTNDGSKKPEDQTWVWGEEKFQENFQEKDKERFIEISYKQDLLPWMKTDLLPNCRNKDVYLKSTLEQYIDYFEGKYFKQKNQAEMNKELNKYLAEKLKLNEIPIENISILEEKIKDIQKIQEHLNNVLEENYNNCWDYWFKKLSEDFSDYEDFLDFTIIDKREMSEYKNGEQVKFVGVKVTYDNIDFAILLELNSYNTLYFCVSSFNYEKSLDPKLKEVLKIITDGIGPSEEVGFRYCWRATTYKEGYSELKSLIEKVKEHIKKTK